MVEKTKTNSEIKTKKKHPYRRTTYLWAKTVLTVCEKNTPIIEG
tara:strand:- start:250 stop:381 length:132 start_codon:yes stop_codon:yes gene_type:complete